MKKNRRVVYKVVRASRGSCMVGWKHLMDYPKGEIVVADPDSMGIFVFRTLKDAVQFANYPRPYPSFKILRVEPLSRGYTPKVRFGFDPLMDGELNPCLKTNQIVKGTMCYHKIRVLD